MSELPKPSPEEIAPILAGVRQTLTTLGVPLVSHLSDAELESEISSIEGKVYAKSWSHLATAWTARVVSAFYPCGVRA